MAQIFDVVKRNPVLTQRKAGQNLTAGLAVFLSDAETVKSTADGYNSGYAFDGVTVTSNSSGEWVTIATEPTEVYIAANTTITAGQYVMPGAGGAMTNITGVAGQGFTISGRALESGALSSTTLVRLMSVPNMTGDI